MAADDDISFFSVGALCPIWAAGDLVARFKFPQFDAGLCIERIELPETIAKINTPVQKQCRSLYGVFTVELPNFFAVSQIQRVKFSVIRAKINTPIAHYRRSSHRFFSIKFPK